MFWTYSSCTLILLKFFLFLLHSNKKYKCLYFAFIILDICFKKIENFDFGKSHREPNVTKIKSNYKILKFLCDGKEINEVFDIILTKSQLHYLSQTKPFYNFVCTYLKNVLQTKNIFDIVQFYLLIHVMINIINIFLPS